MDAIRTAALAVGQADPVEAEIPTTVNEVRGYVAVENTLGAGVTIPSKLKDATLAIVAYRTASRLPVKSLITEARTNAYKDAVRLLENVARGLFTVEEAEVEDTEISAIQKPSFSGRKSTYGRDAQDGI